MSDLAYLFQNRSLLRDTGVPYIWFSVQVSGQFSRSRSHIYLVDRTAEPALIDKYKDTPGSPFTILNPEYERVICGNKEEMVENFRNWLLNGRRSSFRTVPLLVSQGELTPEWKFLRKADKIDLLYAVRANQAHRASPLLVKAVPELRIKCTDGVTRTLGLLAVPTEKLLRECPHLHFVELPNATREDWGFLSIFGVLTKCNTTARIRELKALSGLPAAQVNREAIHAIYDALSKANTLDKEEIM